MFAKLAAFDQRLVQDAFQPMQDAVSSWRRQSDHLLAVICFLTSACLGVFRIGLDATSAPGGTRIIGCLMALTTASIIHFYGRLNRNSGAPGLFAAGLPVPMLIRLTGMIALALSLISLLFESDTFSVALNGIGDLMWLAGACFAGCMLKRPPPQRVENFAPYISPASGLEGSA